MGNSNSRSKEDLSSEIKGSRNAAAKLSGARNETNPSADQGEKQVLDIQQSKKQKSKRVSTDAQTPVENLDNVILPLEKEEENVSADVTTTTNTQQQQQTLKKEEEEENNNNNNNNNKINEEQKPNEETEKIESDESILILVKENEEKKTPTEEVEIVKKQKQEFQEKTRALLKANTTTIPNPDYVEEISPIEETEEPEMAENENQESQEKGCAVLKENTTTVSANPTTHPPPGFEAKPSPEQVEEFRPQSSPDFKINYGLKERTPKSSSRGSVMMPPEIDMDQTAINNEKNGRARYRRPPSQQQNMQNRPQRGQRHHHHHQGQRRQFPPAQRYHNHGGNPNPNYPFFVNHNVPYHLQKPVTGPPHLVNPSQFNKNRTYQYAQKELYARRKAEEMARTRSRNEPHMPFMPRGQNPSMPVAMIPPNMIPGFPVPVPMPPAVPPQRHPLELKRGDSVASLASSVSGSVLTAMEGMSTNTCSVPVPMGMPSFQHRTSSQQMPTMSKSAANVRDTRTDELRSTWNIGTFIMVWSYTRNKWILAQIFDISGPNGGILEVRYCNSAHSNGYKKARRYVNHETQPVPDEIEVPATENRDVIQVGSIVRAFSNECNSWLKAHVTKCQHRGKIHPSGEDLIVRYIEGPVGGQMRVICRYGPFVQRIGERKQAPLTNILQTEADFRAHEASKINPMNPHVKNHHQPGSQKKQAAITTPDETSLLTTWITLTKQELLAIFGDDEICDRILSFGVSMPVTMDASKHTIQEIIQVSKRINAAQFPGIKFAIKEVNYGFVQCFFNHLNETKSVATLQLFGSKSSNKQPTPYPIVLNENMESLHLDGLQFTDEAFKALIFQINKTKALKNLSLSGMSFNKKKAKLLGFMLTKNTSLLSLNLGHNNIVDQCAHEIIRGLKHNSTLEEIGLQNNSINTVAAWDEVLKHNTTLKSMNLSANNIVNTFFLPSGLETLVLSSNALDYNNLGRLLESLIFHKTKLEHLDISSNPIHELLRFDDVLTQNPQLSELFCDNIGIYDTHLKVIYEALKNSNIHTLSFKSNNLTDHGMSQLHLLCRDFTTIRRLDLRFNCVEKEREAIELEQFITLC